ncbi:MAG: HU family DNA-binding protein [Acidimicrobiia bacterium]|nr:HU family DNA-binding protein [Acidimicrobiia bacterium]
MPVRRSRRWWPASRSASWCSPSATELTGVVAGHPPVTGNHGKYAGLSRTDASPARRCGTRISLATAGGGRRVAKEKSVNKRELAAVLAERLDIDKKTALEFVDEFITTVTDTVATGEDVVLTGFAKFRRVQRGPRLARNPQTGATVKVPAKKAAKITPLKAFKDQVIAGKKAPAKKAPAKKAPAKKAAVKKAPAKKSTAKKAPAKKSTARR